MSKIAKVVAVGLATACLISAATSKDTSIGIPVQIIVTVGHHYGQAAPALTRDDFVITQRYEPLPITNVVPLRGEHAGLDLFLLVDNCSNCEPGSKFQELSHFVMSQMATTAVGVAYIQDGQLKIAQNPTTDHKRAVDALGAPSGSKPANPFTPLAQLIRAWPQGANRRAVLMVSNGINPIAGDKTQDPSVEEALEAAQRRGVTVYVIYHPSADYLKTDYSKLYSGQVQLAHVADETGGEAYFLGFGPLPSLAPFLADLSDHLANQYLVEFMAAPADGTGEMQRITVKTKTPEIEIMVPDQIWIPGRDASKNGRPTATDAPKGERP